MIKIALTNLRKYNEGELIYEWVDLPCDNFDTVFDVIGHDEYFITDYECEIPSIFISENARLETLNELAEQLDDLSTYELRVLKAICEAHTSNLREALDIVSDETYLFYEVEDMNEFVEVLIDEGCFGDIPSNVRNYLDYSKIARDLEFDGFTLTSVGVINID